MRPCVPKPFAIRACSLGVAYDGELPVIKYIYPDGSHCYRALHTTHAVFRNDAGQLIARAAKADGTLFEFEIIGFELLAPGVRYA